MLDILYPMSIIVGVERKGGDATRSRPKHKKGRSVMIEVKASDLIKFLTALINLLLALRKALSD